MKLMMKIRKEKSLITTLTMLITLLLSASILPTALSQGDDKVCSCTPTVYKWKLDFSQTCDYAYIGKSNGTIGIDVGPGFGVKDANCAIMIDNQENLDEETFVPTKVTRYQMIEYIKVGENLERIMDVSHPEGFGGLFDGDILSFTSSFESIDNQIPSALVAYLFAENAKGETIQLQWFVIFSNICDKIPFRKEDHLGWTVYVSHQCHESHYRIKF
jgi:hypothetical protein